MPYFPRVCRSIAFAMLAVALTARAEKPFAFTETPGQLPKTIVPQHYTLRLQPDLEARATIGTAQIDIEVRQPTRSIVLNALELDVTSAELLRGGNSAQPERLAPQLDADKQTLALALASDLPPGKHVLKFSFRGKIGTQAQGFFVDKYPTKSGDKLMLGTQMEPTDARRVFPCWDEPVYRATYDITLVVRDNLMAVANTPIEHETPLAGQPGWKEVRFARTPSMASYLVALYAGEFETAEGEQDGVKLRIITTEGKRASALYALESTKRILAYYNEYFGVRYPLPKLDQIAVPNAFSSFGAMENWGLITYIDTALLYDPQTSSQSRREAAFETIAHEMAHQWFGDLVTMAWWDNLWLNEGFASWMGTKCSDALNPDWHLWLRANADKNRAMALDARKTTHPIQRPIANESQASDAFDEISYQKGQSFLRMLEAYLGEDTFRAGIRRYMTRHKYSSTTTADLWAALAEASGKPVVALAAGWTEQPGFPVVVISEAQLEGRPALRLEQTRFSVNYPDAPPLSWQIPVTVADMSGPAAPTVALLEGRSLLVPRPTGTGPIKANLGDSGYYRVGYSENLAAALRERIASLPPGDQMNLLSDTWSFVEAGRERAAQWLSLAEKLGASRNAPLLANLANRLLALDHLQRNQPGRRAYQAWVVQFFSPQLARLGWDAIPNESPLDASLRSQLISLLGVCGDRRVIAECNRRFAAYLKEPASLPGQLRTPVLEVTGRYATPKIYEQLHTLARAALTTEEKRRAYSAMQSALDPALAQETLALTLSGELSTREATGNVAAVAAAENAGIAWDYARAHMDDLLKQMTFFGRNAYVPRIMQAFTDAPRADELEAYTRDHLPPEAAAEAAKTADRIRHLSAVKKRELSVIDGWVKERVKIPE